jgi:hypothetical protein
MITSWFCPKDCDKKDVGSDYGVFVRKVISMFSGRVWDVYDTTDKLVSTAFLGWSSPDLDNENTWNHDNVSFLGVEYTYTTEAKMTVTVKANYRVYRFIPTEIEDITMYKEYM